MYLKINIINYGNSLSLNNNKNGDWGLGRLP